MEKELLSEPTFALQRWLAFFDLLQMKFKTISFVCFMIFGTHVANALPVLPQQQVVVTGTVTDSNNMPLPGVTVLEMGTTNGTQTDFDGNYSLELESADAVLQFSYVGMATLQRDVEDDLTINVVMEQSAESLEEVVLVGYGTQQKSDLTGSIGVVSGEELTRGPVTNPLQGLQGQVAGVKVSLNSGSPSSSPRVLIRGIGTINSSSDPLYVVDGVVMENIRFLNPNDIQSMEVLKDASSTAIYGARGANGVILISTKRGAKTIGTVIGYEAFLSIGVLPDKIDVLNSEEFLEVLEIGFNNHSLYSDSPIPEFTRNDPDLFDSEGNPLYDTDWQEEATRTAISHNHQLSFRSKGENSSFGAFLNYADMEGIMLNNYLERLSGKIAYDANPKDWLSVGLNLLVNNISENEFEEGGGHQMPRRSIIEMPPIFPVKFPDGTWSNSGMVSDPYGLEAIPNPV
ncbi:MAG TPA: SusC/RagA family TonB-linked outer membrane protein, partial [Salinimicrobium sp.]|nr:SusC/RagA family TonB-linked outer membrane protein [Salinimicrobium sp.]